MDTITTTSQLRERIGAWRREGARIGFVPTMGNLHNGHFSLVTLCRENADRTVASVFVNPTQFGPSEDFTRYPRTLERDSAGLAAHGCDVLFAPSVEEVYPFGIAATTRVEVPQVGDLLEGAMRPGHFIGVATVVTKLFNLVQPDVAVFGRKDYQQLLVIQRLVRDLCLPIAILAAPTQREADGLAMSSRNQYLSVQERATAVTIHATLLSMRDALRAGEPLEGIELRARERLTQAGFATDYALLRRCEDLADLAPGQRSGLIALIAAKLGTTRLIDNLLL